MAAKTKKKGTKAKFAKGKKVTSKQAKKLLQNAPLSPEPIVLDRVAKTFAHLQAQRESSSTPIIESDSLLEHVDERGLIHNIIHEPVGAVALITSKANTVRANHYHKEDAHLCYVVSGSIEYYERVAGSNVVPRRYVIKSGGAFYTGPMMEHAMYFPEETVFLTLGRLSRTPDEYEKDLVRLKVPLAEPKKLVASEPKSISTPKSETPTVEVPVIVLPPPSGAV